MYLGLRVLAGSLWAAALALLIAGAFMGEAQAARMVFAWCFFLTSAAMVLSMWVIVDHLITHESNRNAKITADAVGEVLRQLSDDGQLRSVPRSTRRGT